MRMRSWLIAAGLLMSGALCRADVEDWTVHEQFTTVLQAHPPVHALYTGPLSLSPQGEGRSSISATFYLGRRLWPGASLYVNPEMTGGEGFSRTEGVAGFPNGEAFRVSGAVPKFYLARLYLQQIFALDDTTETLESDQNRLAGPVPQKRLTLIGGRFSLIDFFDDNTYSHDPRTQFLNWALFTNGAWDYAADTHGYTNGIYAEYNQPAWAIRAATTMVPEQANGLILDSRISEAHADELELEWRYKMNGHPGKVRPLAFWNHAHMGNYQDATDNPAFGLNVVRSRSYSEKYGFGLNLEQEVTSDLGFFSRTGWDNGKTETWSFTEIDRTFSMGLNYKGTAWNRKDDCIGLAFVVNGLSSEHRDYLRAGGLDFNIGDGQLNYAPEQIAEAFYMISLFKKHLALTTDFQFIKNPAYNADRGPVVVGGERIHIEF